MKYLLCRNTVLEVDAWLDIFRSHEESHREAGLILEHLWQEVDDPNTMRYLFRVEDEAKARAFLSAPEAGEAAAEAGVINGEFHWVEGGNGYR